MNDSRIMLVDDEEFVINSLKRSLRREGYEIVCFTEAEKALEYLKTNRVDVVISDHRMPTMSGIDFLIEVRKRYKNVIRILLTGFADTEVAIRAVNEGKLYRFLTKPWNDEELKVTLINALELRDLLERNHTLAKKIKEQDRHIQSLEKDHPGITQIERDYDGAIIIDDCELKDISFIK